MPTVTVMGRSFTKSEETPSFYERVSPPNWKDCTRRSLPPHSITKNLRLACQTEILGDITVIKHQGFWGHQEPVSF